MGFGFEEFDGLGVYRTTEHGLPVDSSGVVLGTGEIDGPYQGASELATKLAGSSHLRDCFTRQAYRYAMGDIEPGGLTLASLQAGFASDAPMVRILLNLLTNPIFATRSFEGAAP